MQILSPATAPTPLPTAVGKELVTAEWCLAKQRWAVVSAYYEAAANDLLLLDTSAGAFNVDLPEAPTLGCTVGFGDLGTHWQDAAPTILGNGHTIHGDSILVLDVPSASVILVFNGSEWRVQR